MFLLLAFALLTFCRAEPTNTNPTVRQNDPCKAGYNGEDKAALCDCDTKSNKEGVCTQAQYDDFKCLTPDTETGWGQMGFVYRGKKYDSMKQIKAVGVYPIQANAILGMEVQCQGASPGRACGEGEYTVTATSSCCWGEDQCEGSGSSVKTETEKCELPTKCGILSPNQRAFSGLTCDKRFYVGKADDAADCEAQVFAHTPAAQGFFLNCVDQHFAMTTSKRSNKQTKLRCYGCTTKEASDSDCGSNLWLTMDYSTQYTLFAVFVGLAVVLTIAIVVSNIMCSDGEVKQESNLDRDDPLQIEMSEEWCPCLGCGCTLAPAVTVLCFVGIAIGCLLNIGYDNWDATAKNWMDLLWLPGVLWVNLLKLIVVPLISLMMLTLPARIDILQSKLGLHLFLFYVCTSFLAACEGLIWVNIIKPGNQTIYVRNSKPTSSDLSTVDAFTGLFHKAIPKNLFTALAGTNILGIIVFFLSLGIFIELRDNQGRRLVKKEWRDTMISGSKALLKGVMLMIPPVVRFTPIAMVSILMQKVASVDNLANLLSTEGMYLVTVIVGHGVHSFIVYPLILFFMTKMTVNPFTYYRQISLAPFIAFSTSSSAATLPVTLNTLKTRANIRPAIADFIAPIGAAINMDGTSLGFPIMVMFTAQLIKYEIPAAGQITVAIIAMVSSIGTAPIPNAGLLYIAMLFTAAGGPLASEENIAFGLGMITLLDWFVDRVETAENVLSDCVATKIFDTLGYDDLNYHQDDMESKGAKT